MSKNQKNMGQKLKSYKRTPFSFLVMLLVMLSAVITFCGINLFDRLCVD